MSAKAMPQCPVLHIVLLFSHSPPTTRQDQGRPQVSILHPGQARAHPHLLTAKNLALEPRVREEASPPPLCGARTLQHSLRGLYPLRGQTALLLHLPTGSLLIRANDALGRQAVLQGQE